MQIRPFRESDTEAVSALWRDVFRDDPQHNAPEAVIRQKLAFGPTLFFVGELDGTVVGSVLSGYDGHRGWLYSVAVTPKWRRQGWATQLVRHAEKELRALGCTKINLQARAANPMAVEFYKVLGYEVEDRVSMGKLVPAQED